MATLLDIQGLTISFPNATPVKDLSFQVAEAETLAIGQVADRARLDAAAAEDG